MLLIAPTAFKGTHSAPAVCHAISRAAASRNLDFIERPVSDGGPGLIDALLAAQSGDLQSVTVTGPLGAPVSARILLQPGRAVIESAEACGLHLVPADKRDPMRGSTYGVGELINAAATRAPVVFVGLGGSATVDGGAGMARSLGPLHARVVGLFDVRNPLFGPNGAAHVFGPQKGATPEQVELLEAQLRRYAGEMLRDRGLDVASMAGAGAAGGLGAGLVAFANAELVSGSDWLLREIGFDALLERAHLLVTGEGAYDAQSSMGKITGELIARAQRRNVPVLLIAGSVSGHLPENVQAVAGGESVSLADIERLANEGLAQLLMP